MKKSLIITVFALAACNPLTQQEQKDLAIANGHAAFQNSQPAGNVPLPVNYFIAPTSSTQADHSEKAIAPTHKEEHVGKSPLEALQGLVEGNQRFVAGKSSHSNQGIARRGELAAGQKPEAIILSCSDSRVPPELVFDKGLGEVFVVRTAGEVADQAAVASIEYAVEHLHSKLIIVMGHSSCGAVKAALTTPENKSAGSPSLDSLVSAIRPGIKEFKLAPDDKTFIAPVKANVTSVAKGLSIKSSIIDHALKRGEIMIVEALYNLDSGKVDFSF